MFSLACRATAPRSPSPISQGEGRGGGRLAANQEETHGLPSHPLSARCGAGRARWAGAGDGCRDAGESGREERNSRWAHARRRYNAGYGVKSRADMQAVLAFFEERRGRFHSFLWRDGLDYSSNGTATPTALDQVIGTGDGVKVSFSLTKRYGASFRPLSEADHQAGGGVGAGGGGGSRAGCRDFSVDALTGVVTLDVAPGMGAAVTAGFLFDVPVRFDTDRLDIELTSFDAAEAPSYSADRGARMRTLEMGFAAHLASGATTLATCWRIARRDGVVLGFTDHDEALSFDGDDLRAGAWARWRRGAEQARGAGRHQRGGGRAALGRDRRGAISCSGAMTGRAVETWRVNWRDVTQRVLVRTSDDRRDRARGRGVSRRTALGAGGAEPGAGPALSGAVRCRTGRCALRRGSRGLRHFGPRPAVIEVRDRFRIAVDGIDGLCRGLVRARAWRRGTSGKRRWLARPGA